MLREIVFDTETTGFNPEEGDKLVEIGAVELINHIPTGRTYHQYINPDREVPEEVVKVHGLTTEFLKDYPKIGEVAQSFIDFVGDDGILVAHNATFDMNFINYEFKHKGFRTFPADRVVDTLEIAKSKFPGARNNLDALCRRFNIDNSSRTKHGALLDAELLAEVYLELLGGAEPSMNLENANLEYSNLEKANLERTNLEKTNLENANLENSNIQIQNFHEPRSFPLTADEEQAHETFLKEKLTDAVWLK